MSPRPPERTGGLRVVALGGGHGLHATLTARTDRYSRAQAALSAAFAQLQET